MKNWKFIKVGNENTVYIIAPNGEKVKAIDYDQWHYKCVDTGELVEKRFSKVVGNEATGPNWDKKRQLEDELRGWMTMVNKLDGEEKRNAEKQIADIRKELNDFKIKIAHGENKKAGNESIDKQEWSMFKGLSKDAEKEVGNAYTPNPELIKILEAWLHNRMSEQEAREKIMKITGDKNITDMMIHSPGGFIPAGNKKTCNQSAQDKFIDDINGIKEKYKQEGKELNLSRLMYELKRIGWAESDFTKLKWPTDIRNSKTGNAGVDTEIVDRGVVEGKEYIVEKTRLRNGQDVQFNLYYSMDGSGKRHAGVFKDKDSAVSAGKKIVGNETAEEKKFGKVMREFDRGELKSSSGETVTNPEQAKAIAYSESEKVDNLKRARNKMAK